MLEVRGLRKSFDGFRAIADVSLAVARRQITAVIACRTDPQTVIVLKGNRPLELRWHPRRKAVLYASDPAYLRRAGGGKRLA